ncbi:MAG: response regulator [Rhodospirillales bacterium]|nr:response regulator [Alphaproteobacteria bacterium]USO03549.1 MAG: response regulator [Rhodospirillales bacterium]
MNKTVPNKNTPTAEPDCQNLMKNAADGVVTIDKKGIICGFNLKCEEMFGLSAEKAMGQNVKILMPQTYAQDHDQYILNYLETGTKNIIGKTRETLAQKADGSTFPIELSVSDTFIGNQHFFNAIIRDITNRKEIEQALARSQEEAHAALKAKSEFLAKMSHEIRTPLNGILGFADLLKQTPLDEYQTHCVANMKSAGQTLTRLIDDILEFSKNEKSKDVYIEKAPFSLTAIVNICREIIIPELRKKHLTFSVDIRNSVPQTLISDQYRLQQVFLNLLTNAVEFTQEGEIRFEADCTPQKNGALLLKIKVSDTGIGIPEEKHEEIFKPFSQETHHKQRTFGGTGLGLSVVKQIIQALEGRIELQSAPGEGTVFSLQIPVEEYSVKEEETPSLPQGAIPKAANQMLILVAEDIPMNQEVAVAMLAQMGHSAQVARDGKEAVEAVKTGQFDLVLMDIQMPEMDGLEATKIIRKDLGLSHEELPILALTAHALPEEVKAAFEAGMDDYITKPVSAEELFQKLEEWNFSDDFDPFAPEHLFKNVQEQAKISNLRPDLLIDEMQLYTFIGLIGEDKITDVYSSFKSDFEKKKLIFSAASPNPADIAKELHALKSTSGNLGMVKLSEFSIQLMNDIKSGKIEDLSKPLEELLALYQETTKIFDEHLKRLGAI